MNELTCTKGFRRKEYEIFIAEVEKTSVKILPILVVFAIVATMPSVFAEPTVEIILDKTTYNYGDKLFYTIKVSEITGDNAIIHIIDETGKGSSAIPIPIMELETPLPAQYPFEKEVFSEGKYYIEVSYSGASDKVEFNLVDAGNVVIPFWIKQVAYYWISQGVADQTYADAIEHLIKNNIIVLPNTENIGESESKQIPAWVKTSTLWWLEEKISDNEYAQSLQYLIKSGIIVV